MHAFRHNDPDVEPFTIYHTNSRSSQNPHTSADMATGVSRDLTTAFSEKGLLRIGTGCCGSVWADADSSNNDTPSCIKREDGNPHRSISNEYNIHQLVIQSVQYYPQYARNFRIPLCRGFLDQDDQKSWSLVLPRLPPGSKPCNALLSEKVQPVSEQVRKLLVNKFARGTDLDAIANDGKNEHCLIRPYLGRRKKVWGDTNRNTFFSLRNFPLHLERMIELELDVESYAKVMAEGLAFLHWVVRIDANDVEFVLARSRSTSHSQSPFVPDILGPHSMWIIDFDCCDPISLDEKGVASAAECFWWNDPYYPRPGSDNDPKLWSVFREHFLQVSSEILKDKEQSVQQLPNLLMNVIEEGSRPEKGP
ncbi:calcineurin-like phosphoesterase [Fusarium austroafricanum]|uniref:Calcineurin-like phosphoesterase n=1 Tax=Fusarium austroafricanum TaxID=2364996 RepID=A0A8H4NXG9_9HYPO|nr:calcineurin-like phosphoesterase [Fusarium austroafricanum]